MGRGPTRPGGATGSTGGGAALREAGEGGSAPGLRSSADAQTAQAVQTAPAAKPPKAKPRKAPATQAKSPAKTKKQSVQKSSSQSKKINKDKVKKGAKYAAIAATGPVGVSAVGYKKYRDWNRSGAWKNSSWGQASAHYFGVNQKGNMHSIPGSILGVGALGAGGGAYLAASFGTPMAPVAGLAAGGAVAVGAAGLWRTKRQIDKGKIRPNLKYDEKEAKLEARATSMGMLATFSKSNTLSTAFGLAALKRSNDVRKYKNARDRIPKSERHKYAKKKPSKK